MQCNDEEMNEDIHNCLQKAIDEWCKDDDNSEDENEEKG